MREGVNPTDTDSAGKDQHPDNNPGIPFNGPAIDSVIAVEKEKDESEREYQMALHNIMNKRSEDIKYSEDPNIKNPDEGPEGHTSGGTIDDDARDIIKKHIEIMDDIYDKENSLRREVPIKTTSTMFRQDRYGQYTPREDDKTDVNQDKSGPAASQLKKERDKLVK